MTATPQQLIEAVRAAGGFIAVSGDRIVLKAPSPLPDPLVQALRTAKQDVIHALTEREELAVDDHGVVGTPPAAAPRSGAGGLAAQVVGPERQLGPAQGEPRSPVRGRARARVTEDASDGMQLRLPGFDDAEKGAQANGAGRQSPPPSDAPCTAAFEPGASQEPADGSTSIVLPEGEAKCPDILTTSTDDLIARELRDSARPPGGSGRILDAPEADEAGTGDTASLSDVAAPARVPQNTSESGDRGKLVVKLPEGWRVIETPVQWIVQAPMKSATSPWRSVAFHITRDSLIRQLPERLWGARSGRVLPDDVLAVLRALRSFHPGEGKNVRATGDDAADAARHHKVKRGARRKRVG